MPTPANTEEAPADYSILVEELLEHQRFRITEQAWQQYIDYIASGAPYFSQGFTERCELHGLPSLPLNRAIHATVGNAVATAEERDDTYTEREEEIYELMENLEEAVWRNDAIAIALAQKPFEIALQQVFATPADAKLAAAEVVAVCNTAAKVMKDNPGQSVDTLFHLFRTQSQGRQH